MSTRLAGFKGEYLWEFDAQRQLRELAEAFPANRYGWRPADRTRTVSEILVHISAGNLTLLGMVGIEAAPDVYGQLEGEVVPRMMAMLARNDRLEKDIQDKAAVIALLERSLAAARTAFSEVPEAELERMDTFFGQRTTVRRVYMRGLTHMHEHMGQLVAYMRVMGMPAPWPDWRESGKKIIERGQSAQRPSTERALP
jgi:uncharacterized damage-inducible protein DinB